MVAGGRSPITVIASAVSAESPVSITRGAIVKASGWAGLRLDAGGVLGLVEDHPMLTGRPQLEFHTADRHADRRPNDEAVVPGVIRHGDEFVDGDAIGVPSIHRLRVHLQLFRFTEPRVPSERHRERVLGRSDTHVQPNAVVCYRECLLDAATERPSLAGGHVEAKPDPIARGPDHLPLLGETDPVHGVATVIEREPIRAAAKLELPVPNAPGPRHHRICPPGDRGIVVVAATDQDRRAIDGDLTDSPAVARFDLDHDVAGGDDVRAHRDIIADRDAAWQAAHMRGLVQRVEQASVDVIGDDGLEERSGQIGPGLCVLVGATHSDGDAEADRLAEKLWQLRILDDDAGVMNRSLAMRLADGESAEVLVVSQFTLFGNTDKGRRPSWIDAARPEHAEPLVERIVAQLRERGATVQTGRFRTKMRVHIVNDGPVTLMLEV